MDLKRFPVKRASMLSTYMAQAKSLQQPGGRTLGYAFSLVCATLIERQKQNLPYGGRPEKYRLPLRVPMNCH